MDRRLILLWRITIALGVVGVLLGLLLRYFFIQPLAFNFKYVLHAHSHLMLLGWLFSGLLLLIYRQWFAQIPGLHFWLLLALQLCVLGMLCSFPFQGYGLYAISFSTLHIFISYVLLFKLWKHSQGRGLPGKMVRAGIVFHSLSTLGPYALGPIVANNMRGTALYDQAIYFYLHFQYNGSFFMFLLALIFQQWQRAQGRMYSRLFLWLMLLGVVLTWAHSLEFSYSGWWINALGFTGSALQIIAGAMLLKQLNFSKAGKTGILILVMLALKWLFQLLGSAPDMGDFVAQNRFLIIAWLHFIFLGIYTPFIWLQLPGIKPHFNLGLAFYWSFFLLTELVLIFPVLGLFPQFANWPQLIFSAYLALAIAWFALAFSWWKLQSKMGL